MCLFYQEVIYFVRDIFNHLQVFFVINYNMVKIGFLFEARNIKLLRKGPSKKRNKNKKKVPGSVNVERNVRKESDVILNCRRRDKYGLSRQFVETINSDTDDFPSLFKGNRSLSEEVMKRYSMQFRMRDVSGSLPNKRCNRRDHENHASA